MGTIIKSTLVFGVAFIFIDFLFTFLNLIFNNVSFMPALHESFLHAVPYLTIIGYSMIIGIIGAMIGGFLTDHLLPDPPAVWEEDAKKNSINFIIKRSTSLWGYCMGTLFVIIYMINAHILVQPSYFLLFIGSFFFGAMVFGLMCYSYLKRKKPEIFSDKNISQQD